jgi:hypothetical protein
LQGILFGSLLYIFQYTHEAPERLDPFPLTDPIRVPDFPFRLSPKDPVAVLTEISGHLVGQDLPYGPVGFGGRLKLKDIDINLWSNTFFSGLDRPTGQIEGRELASVARYLICPLLTSEVKDEKTGIQNKNQTIRHYQGAIRNEIER